MTVRSRPPTVLRFLRPLRPVATFTGAVVLGLLALLVGLVALRFGQVSLVGVAPPDERSREKARYLASLAPVDPDAAPSFVVILFDDLGWGDLSIQGNRLIRTPRIDAIAAAGLRMEQFYSAAPVCTPSRAALLSGRYPVRSRTHLSVFFAEGSPLALLRRMLGQANELPRDEILVPEALRAAGYATGMIGKWHLGGVAGHRPLDFGFDSFFGVLWSNDMQPLHLYRGDEIETRDETPRQPFGAFRHEDDAEPRGVDQRRLTRRYTEEAIAFLEANRERPFFLYLAHTFPHVPHFADPETAGRSAGGVYGDVVEDLDRSTGAVIDALDRLGLSERTLVVITSDNGAAQRGSAGPLRGRKSEVWEGGQRVPLIVRRPGRVPAGRVSQAMAMNFDLFPTLLAQAGLPLPGDRVIDGRDLGPLWAGDAPAGASPHDHLFYFSTLSGVPAGVRDARFKYLRSSGDPGRDRPILTDLLRDHEAHDVSGRHPEAAEALASALDAFSAELETNPRGWRNAP